uniref:Uncharacterized protein n=1 Tax=Romanomermis culicivorax TaxID=13658 RepID=A0A915HNC4_ROMCU
MNVYKPDFEKQGVSASAIRIIQQAETVIMKAAANNITKTTQLLLTQTSTARGDSTRFSSMIVRF